MTLMVDPGYALKFNGISDSVLVPPTKVSLQSEVGSNRSKLPKSLSSFTIEAWVIPDAGGVIIEYENLFRLSVGSPSSPAPATFECRLQKKGSGVANVYNISSAQPVYDPNGDVAYWDGILFPRAGLDIHNSYLAKDGDSNDITALNEGHRELLNVVVTFNRNRLALLVNGDMVSSHEFEEEQELLLVGSRIFLGGRGGEYRGTMEAVHWSTGESQSASAAYGPIKTDNTLGLWRFEEPVTPLTLTFDLPALTASTSASVISVGTTVAQDIVDQLSGRSGLTAMDFTASPYSVGQYKVDKITSGSKTTVNIPQVPYNILINPLGYNSTTGRPNNEAPERVRLMAVDSSAGTITVESIHIDFSGSPTTGRRGLLMNRSASTAVFVTGDALVDGGSGTPYQSAGTGTQFSHRQGQVVIDESIFENHGLMFSMSMAVVLDDYNKYSATTKMGDGFLIGHTGRHTLNHVKSHPFMGTLPEPQKLEVEQQLDATSDVVQAFFPEQHSNIKAQVPANSVVSTYSSHGPIRIQSALSADKITSVIENGMAGIDDSKRGLLAIGAPKLNLEMFALKSIDSDIGSTELDRKYTIPSAESRIALLEVPSLASYDYAPFIQVHYNAIDPVSRVTQYKGTGRLTSAISGGGTVLTLNSVKAFGADGTVFRAGEIIINGVLAGDFDITAAIDYATNTITFSSATTASFQTEAVADALVHVITEDNLLLVEKTVPDVSTVVSGSTRIIDLIHTDIDSAALNVHAPGGVIEIKKPSIFPFSDGDLNGDDTEGTAYETDYQVSEFAPSNYLPVHSGDTPQQINSPIPVARSDLVSHESVFNKLVLSRTTSDQQNVVDQGSFIKQRPIADVRPRTGVLVNGNFAAGTLTFTVDGTDATTKFVIGQSLYRMNGKKLGTITGVTTTSITIGSGSTEATLDNEELFPTPVRTSSGTVNQSTTVNEVFDIIDQKNLPNDIVRLIVQPSDRRRFSQLSKLNLLSSQPNTITIKHLVSRARVLSFTEDARGRFVMRAHGLLSDLASSNINVKGDGAPDSHIVKEIMPGAPVVTMTLGGPGQGAINTKETWDPSPTARLGWSTRRDCATRVTAFNTTTITVAPLNNKSTDLQSWGTYCFPKAGKVYFALPKDNSSEQTRFASAEYDSKDGDTFTFSAGSIGSGKYILPSGREVASLADWTSDVGLIKGSNLHVDDKFSEETICNDGTTINDRLFQTLDTVTHDYQLGTQYASTRAMVEIPLFEEFFFDKPELGIFPGPDNSMKLHIDATHTAHTWAPNPVGRRPDDIAPADPEVHSAFSYGFNINEHRTGTMITQKYDVTNRRVYVQDASIFPIPTTTASTVAQLDGSLRYRRAFINTDEWVMYESRDTTNNYLQVVGGSDSDADSFAFSENFLRDLEVGISLTPAHGHRDSDYASISDNPLVPSAGLESRRPYYYDRANTMTQGGNVDYGLKQYVSAVEFRAGPTTNPHLERIQVGRARAKVTEWASPNLTLDDASLFPDDISGTANYRYRVAYYNSTTNAYIYAHYDTKNGNILPLLDIGGSFNPSVGDEIILWDVHESPAGSNFPKVREDFFLNKAWSYPYAPGGLRDGDTVWMNMHYTNPHAIEGLFCKSRGVLNEASVWTAFNGGEGTMDANPRDSIPMENFLIGNTCLETAKNFVQHVNKTIELNYEALGLDADDAPVVAYIDPYQSTEEFTRVLLYDVGHDREFIAFQDLWMQVQSSAEATTLGNEPSTTTGVVDNTVDGSGTGLDVAAGFPSQNKNLNSTEKSEFMEGAMAHKSDWNANVTDGLPDHTPQVSSSIPGSPVRTNEAVVDGEVAKDKHAEITSGERENSTFFDTPDGTRAIPAFLALKGIRASALDLSDHEEDRLQYLDHWSKMDFVRRLTVDLGEVGFKEGVTDIEAAANEVVRLINQAGAKNGRSHARRPADQYLGESERFDITHIGVKADSTNRRKDPTASHIHADFSATGSTHDPAPFWDVKQGFANHDRGTHMGYVRAHIGRVVLDSHGNKGYSIIIHSTIPGAEGRNFCTWLDNSKAQTPYRPQYLIGHGGRFRNYWCQPDEVTGENMHPAPMPINRFGRPFAPITTLKEFLPPEEVDEPLRNNLEFGPELYTVTDLASDSTNEGASGRNANTVMDESFETKSPSSTLVDGLRVGTTAKARINFGGFTQAGFPGWAPDAGKWGFGRDLQDDRFNHIYGNNSRTHEAMYDISVAKTASDGYIPEEDVQKNAIGDGQLYGIRLVDHRGGSHTIRMVYRQYGYPFANDLTTLPPTIDNEIVIHFDDRDVSQGGFTIGQHMVGEGEVCGELTGGTASPFKGNLWNNYPSPAAGLHCAATSSGVGASRKLTVVFSSAPYDTASTSLSHPDMLGYLGFPDSGMIQLSTASGLQGMTFHYTSRTHNDNTGVHEFYGVKGVGTLPASPHYISARINFTTLLTDEVIAAAVEHAINMEDPNSNDVRATSLDVSHLWAPDGRTLGDWGLSDTAIRIKAHSDKHRVLPLRHLFEVSCAPDWGLQDGASTDTVGTDHLGGLTEAEIDSDTRLDVGYIPHTVLHINTKYRGANANTATPVLVDTNNNVVDVTKWQRNLRGEDYTKFVGDHIIPMVNNPMIQIDNSASNLTHNYMDLITGTNLFLICTPASANSNSWGNKFTMYVDDTEWGVVRSDNTHTTPESRLKYEEVEISANFETKLQPGGASGPDPVFCQYGDHLHAIQVEGIRRAGSKKSSPFLYFRGGRDSPDHWVPLYFGGGFSGVTIDINDGTQNDYTEFYTHPYSSGPTGSAGLQNVGEIAGAYALLDANAMLAMFPGTPYLDQHRGQNNPPFFNQDSLLPYDMDSGTSQSEPYTGISYSGTICTRPSPIVLRFAHPHARYSATGEQNDQTVFMIYGPGQSFPHNTATFEPQAQDSIVVGNGYSAVPIDSPFGDSYLPNQITQGGADRSGAQEYLPPTSDYQIGNVRGYNLLMNWEPTKGFPNYTSSTGMGYCNTNIEALYYNTSLVVTPPQPYPKYAHPMDYVITDFNGAALGSKTRKCSMVWQMDGGYHPGGHFLDNHYIRNPKHPVSNNRLPLGSGAQPNVTMFRAGGQLATGYLSTFTTEDDIVGNENVILVDATRCQNAEELGAVVAAAINTFPGKDPLKAIGGTFLPSMQNAHKQDRYGWHQLEVDSFIAEVPSTSAAIVNTLGGIPSTLPDYGWLRFTSATGQAGYASYVGFSGNSFTLGSNPQSPNSDPVEPDTGAPFIPLPGDFVYVWTKAGTHRYNNNAADTSRDHMCQVHFNGLTDAVDRTKPFGALGWHGEMYSYMNSYKVENPGLSGNVYPAGKGAWHPLLGFSPYGSAETCVGAPPPVGANDTPQTLANDHCVTGLSSRHLIAVTHESELPLIAKTDRDGILCAGDWLELKATSTLANAGTVAWDTDKIHNKDRYVGPATAGPRVEAQIAPSTSIPSTDSDYPVVGGPATWWYSQVRPGQPSLQADSCLSPTGDLFWDEKVVPGSAFHEDFSTKGVKCEGVTNQDYYMDTTNGIYAFYKDKAAARNFSAEHVVWKRMDGGSLTMPGPSARGLGLMPWVKRKDGSEYKLVGEKILGNVRFSFETTNGAMFPIIQAQELSHPQIAEQHPFEVRNALAIPNEEMQFQSLLVTDDTGQEHRLEGGSPLGTVIYDFRHVSDRDVEGLAPALAGTGVSPNMKIRLPNPDEIPGNVIVRPGFDRIQAYQNETIGSGGLHHPAQGSLGIREMFDNEGAGPRLWPTWEINGWEHLSQDVKDTNIITPAKLATGRSRISFPDSTNEGWSLHTNNAPLKSAYEPHDRSLFFHVTRMGVSMTHRDDVDELYFDTNGADTITALTAPSSSVWQDTSEKSGGRWFLRVYDPTTDKGVIASYEGVSGNDFTSVVFAPDFAEFVKGKSGLKIVPSYYMPAGSTRFFAARRLRDQSEYSGASPDMMVTDYENLNSVRPYDDIIEPIMTPMPIPRMGHHYVTPTMALLPGHYAHPAYQRLYDLNQACRSSTVATLESGYDSTDILDNVPGRDPLIWFSGITAAFGPSDIHGGAFTLLTETKVKYEGYGIAASVGPGGNTNSQGGHALVMEAAAAYTLKDHFPDPMEVGAYQIVIQPNLFAQQLKGFHQNHSDATKAPSESGTKVTELTGQQVNTVVAIEHDTSATNGAFALILAEATMADVRGCEVIINEVILDMEPDAGSQFTNIPSLGLYNPLGLQETNSPSLTRRSLPYRPGMFISATPGYTATIPWWGILHREGANASGADKFKHLEWHKPDNYYEFCRASYGSVGAQLTLAGYPTTYLDIYEEHKRLRSLNPSCTVISVDSSAQTITVDNNDLFPVEPYYGEVLEYFNNGRRYTSGYTNRTGTNTHATLGQSTTFEGVTAASSNKFWDFLLPGTVLRLSGPFDNRETGAVFTNSEVSAITRLLPQTMHGSRDTNSLHTPDAYLCLWHHNLGRPFTWYSDDSSRGFYDKTGSADTPVTKKGFNSIPEHFETIHYHDFYYSASKGPFGLKMKWISPPGSAGLSDDGTVYTATAIDADANLSHQGGTDESSNKFNFGGMWPSGSHGGGAVSRLETYGDSLIGWSGQTFDMDCIGYHDNTGIETRTYAQMTSSSDYARNYCFGYRFALRQAYNRPRWGPFIRGWDELPDANALLGYYHGPFVQQDGKTNGWEYVGNTAGLADKDFPATYVGILERLTQVTALLNQDQLGRQVRYSDGRRHTAPFGCAVRTIRNASTVRRLYPGDASGKGISDLAEAHRYYIVDWWGNTRGEDVRRFPVRGFGIRPSWDPEDAYKDTWSTYRTSNTKLFGGDGTDAYQGNDNTDNNNGANMSKVDWFNPPSALRVGDRGDGRGVRWPTVFNESLLMEVSEVVDATGLVLSHSTAEPNFGTGYVRPSNEKLQAGEVEKGISSRLDVESDDGLLKPEVMVGESIESKSGEFAGGQLAEPVGRDGMRIGLDVDTLGELNDGVHREYITMSTQAYSLHTDKEVGQRTNIRGAHDGGDRTLKDLDLTNQDFSAQPKSGVVRLSNAHAYWSLGGTYVMTWQQYAGSLSDEGWGKAGASSSSNPYQDSNHDSTKQKTNEKDSTIEFLFRPAQILDNSHAVLFRHPPATDYGPQSGSNYYRATSGGKYGLFLSDAPNARTGTPSAPPYAPVFDIDPAGSLTVPDSQGPKIPGVDVTGYDKKDITNPVARVVMSENTLEHFRADANRKSVDDDEGDYSVEPRYSQTLHPKGSKGDASYNTGDHSGE